MKRRHNTRSSSTSKNKKTTKPSLNSVSIPHDVVVEILLKSSAKSIANFCCTSKLYASTIRSPDFTESFFTISLSRPKLMFTILDDEKTLFFSSPQPQNKSLITAELHKSFQINCISQVSRPVRGLVCGLHQQSFKDETVSIPLLCNPSTGQVLSLPRVKTVKERVINYLGYDPINNQFKVLCMSKPCIINGVSYTEEHQVLTLETGKNSEWRMIKCDVPHTPQYVDHRDRNCVYDGICINGVIYYQAWSHGRGEFADIVCFDIRYEKFHLIKKAEGMRLHAAARILPALVNYKGTLAKLQPYGMYGAYNGNIELWILKDGRKHQWSRSLYVLPSCLEKINAKTKLCFVGMTDKGDIVLSPNTTSDSFYLVYYNAETNITTKVVIQGMEDYKLYKIHTFLDHVEDVRLMEKLLI